MLRSSSLVDVAYSNAISGESEPAQFVGSDIPLSPELTVFGRDLPGFRAWACQNGVTSVRHVTDSAEFFAHHHEFVAHDFGQPVALDKIRQISSRVQSLIAKATRLVLFIDITDHCTIERVHRALRSQMPNLTFRFVYPRGVHKMTGARVIIVEKRRPRVFLFVSSRSMAGKTESALSFAEASGVKVLHGDEYITGIASGEIPAPDDLRRHVTKLWSAAAFDFSLFAQFIEAIPAFKENRDIAFDLIMQLDAHSKIVEFFHERGFFPILCLTRADQTGMSALLEQAQDAVTNSERHERAAGHYRRQVEGFRNSTSWRLTAPLRFLGRRLPALARAGRALRWPRRGKAIVP